MLKLLPKNKYPEEMLYFLAEHTLIIYVNFIIGSKRKNFTPSRTISFQTAILYVYTFSETVLIQRIKLRAIFLAFLEIRLTNVNLLLLNIIRNKRDTAISNLFK